MKAGYVVDSSALLAWLFGEIGKQDVSQALRKGCLINTVNWCEVISKSIQRGISTAHVYEKLHEHKILDVTLMIAPFTEALAKDAASLIKQTKPYGLSLGDRACLALGIYKKLPVLTADTIWANVDLPLDITLIR